MNEPSLLDLWRWEMFAWGVDFPKVARWTWFKEFGPPGMVADLNANFAADDLIKTLRRCARWRGR